jgi:hypothetical protein
LEDEESKVALDIQILDEAEEVHSNIKPWRRIKRCQI